MPTIFARTTNSTTAAGTANSTGRSTADVPAWARRSHRALDHFAMPRLADLGIEVMDDLRAAAYLLIARPIVSVLAFAAAAAQGWWPLAIALGWLVYGSTLTAVHHLIHGSLGLRPRTRRFWLTVLGCLVVESGHALQTTHLAHHRAGADLPDPEGYIENVSWLGLPLGALRFRYRLMLWGLRYSPRRRRVLFELGVHAVLHLASLALLPINPILWVYLTIIHVASFAFAVLAGKGPQTNWGRAVDTPFVRVHTRLGQILFFSHDLHLEHHAYPKVPLFRLRRLREGIEPALQQLDLIDVEMI